MTPAQLECELGERAGATLGLSAQSGAWRGRLVHRPAVINSALVRAGGARGCSKCALQPLGTCRTSAARPAMCHSRGLGQVGCIRCGLYAE